MPFDAIGTTVLPLSSDERWSYSGDTTPKPRGINVHDDNFALYLVLLGIRHRWAKRFNAGDNHCVVGWVANTCEPMTKFKNYSEQSMRLLKRLHAALPKSAQRVWEHPAYTLARYNDTHQNAAVERVAHRAYKMLINEQWGSTPYPEVVGWPDKRKETA